jgi:hypothetical protein
MAQQNNSADSSRDAEGRLSEDLGGRYQAEGYGDDPYTEEAAAENRAYRPRRRFSFDIDKVADDWIDGLIPEEIEWRHLVGKYPRISIGLALVAGYLIGRTQGKALMAAAGAVAIDEISKVVEGSVGDIFS